MVLALTLALAASSAVLPFLNLNEMQPEHACYFLCDLCLEGGPEEDLMDCANKLCSRIKPGATCGPVLDFDMLLLGHKCRDMGLVMQFLGAPQKKH
ncbi:hypothetical protein V1264_019069 [Littorina saxatilis]